MRVPRRLFLLGALILVLGGSQPASAQITEVRRVEVRDDGVVLEVTASWPASLQALRDSSGATAFDRPFARIATYGQLTVSETVDLARLALPPARVLGADFDELRLPLAAGADSLIEPLGRTVEMVALGYFRKRPVATLQVRLLTYDAERGMVRRYRRLRIFVETGRPAALQRLAATRVTNPHLEVAESVLADGTVFKISVVEEGIYRIDRALLSELDLDPDAIDPDEITIYGNGGAPLPALNSAPRPAGLIENPILVRGGGDGSFDAGDEVLFYAKAPRGWHYNAADDEWEHYVNPFSNENVYFLKVDGGEGRRIQQSGFPGWSDAARYTEVTGRYVVDIDEYMWAPYGEGEGTGLVWVSDPIRGGLTRSILEDVRPPGLAGGEVRYHAQVAVFASRSTQVYFESGGAQLASIPAPLTGRNSSAPVAKLTSARFTQSVSADAALNVAMRLQNQAGNPQAAVDWLRVYYPQTLSAQGGAVRFATPGGEAGRMAFVLSGFSQEPQVWDVTEPGTIRRLGVQASGGTYQVQIAVDDPARPRELLAFTAAAVRQPAADQIAAVPAQNLHGIQGYPDFVIVTPEAFLDAANELAEYRRQDGLDVLVAQVEHIYNEFSGGVPDMRAVRDYFKFLYDRASDEARMLRYALLLGDGHFDYRGLANGEQLVNWIFPYETEVSFDPDISYTSDDYFGLLDDAEGVWDYAGTSRCAPFEEVCELVDIGIGRFPVQTLEEAQAMIAKIKHYEDPATYGGWRGTYVFLADDGKGSTDQNEDYDLHVKNINDVATEIEATAPFMNQKKIYAPVFERVYLTRWRFPDVREQIQNAIAEGALVFNYSGHGGPRGLADEDLFTVTDAEQLTNYDRLPIFVTATCSFGRWDMSDAQSGAEALVLNPDGGGVAIFTTVRLVYTSPSDVTLNTGLNIELNRALFELGPDGQARRLGDVMVATKRTPVGSHGNSRKFNLLGDPTMRLGLPVHEAVVTTVNGTSLEEAVAPVRALDRVTLNGEIRTPDGQPATAFNGPVEVAVFDAERRVIMPYTRWMPDSTFTVREDLIWRGQVTASNGTFDATFVVPKDISYSNQPGRISVYAASGAEQAIGATERIVVGGTTTTPPDDARGPQLSLFMNDTTFVSGGLTTREPELIVKLFDESGINTVGAGVGHELLLVINGDESSAVDLSSSFQSEANSYQRGTVRWTLPEQELGAHRLEVRAWDVLNNSSTAELEYVVAGNEELRLANVYNYPNPTTGPTRFIFEHNQPVGSVAQVQVRVYTLSGRAVLTLEEDVFLNAGPVQIPWDGRDDDGDRLATGIYLYKVRVEVDTEDGERQVSERIEKLAVIR